MITKTQKLLGGIAFLIVALFAGIVGVTALGNPKLSGSINIGYEAYEARIGRDTSYVYFSTLKSAVDGAELGEVIEIISPVNLNENITINKNLTINSMIMQGEDTQRDMAVTVGASGGFTISNNAKVNLGELTGKLNFSQLDGTPRTESLFTINSGTLDVTGGKFAGFTKDGSGTIFDVKGEGSLNIYGGEFSNNSIVSESSWTIGGVISGTGSLTIYGGIFKQNSAPNGAVIGIASNAPSGKSINIYGGQFTGNSANKGGVIGIAPNASSGITVNIHGGQFVDNLVTDEGGVIRIINSEINIHSGIFTGNSAEKGGVVHIPQDVSSVTNIHGGQFINNSATMMGGVIYNSKSLNIYGGVFKENKATSSFGGGAIHSYNSSNTYIYTGEFKDNKSDSGAAISTHNATITIEGGAFKNNTKLLSNDNVGINIGGNEGSILNVLNNPFIDDEINLPSYSFIKFTDNTWVKPLKIRKVNFLDSKVAEVENGLDVNDYINKLDALTLISNQALAISGNDIIIGYKVTLDASDEIGQIEGDNFKGWKYESGKYIKGVANGQAIGTLPMPQHQEQSFFQWQTQDGTALDPATIISAAKTYSAVWQGSANLSYFQIGEDTFETLSAAVAEANTKSTPTTIIMLQDYYMTQKITINTSKEVVLTSLKPVVLIRGEEVGNNSLITNNGTLTISGSIIIDGQKDFILSYGASRVIYNYNILNIKDNVQFNNNKLLNTPLAGSAIYNGSSAILTISGNVQFNNNVADGETDGKGGAIYNTGEMIINDNVQFNNNFAYILGGAIYHSSGAFELSGSVKFNNNSTNIIDSNQKGGAIYNSNGTVSITDNVQFNYNSSGTAGAIYNEGSIIMTISGSVQFNGNEALMHGGAIYTTSLSSENLAIKGNVQFNNNQAGTGGAISIYKSIVEIKNNVQFNGNKSTDIGGAIRTGDGSTLLIKGNVQFNENSSLTSGGAIHIYTSSDSLEIKDSVQFNENSSASNGTLQGGGAIYAKGTVTISGNVQFNENKHKNTDKGTNGGGAIFNNNGTMTIKDNVKFNGNSFDSSDGSINGGGAIFNYNGTMTINGNVLFNDNKAINNGDGGAIYIRGNTTITGSVVFSNNIANSSSAAIHSGAGTFEITISTVIFINNDPQEIKGTYTDIS